MTDPLYLFHFFEQFLYIIFLHRALHVAITLICKVLFPQVNKGVQFYQKALQSYDPLLNCSLCDGKHACEVSSDLLEY